MRAISAQKMLNEDLIKTERPLVQVMYARLTKVLGLAFLLQICLSLTKRPGTPIIRLWVRATPQMKILTGDGRIQTDEFPAGVSCF